MASDTDSSPVSLTRQWISSKPAISPLMTSSITGGSATRFRYAEQVLTMALADAETATVIEFGCGTAQTCGSVGSALDSDTGSHACPAWIRVSRHPSADLAP